MFRPRTHVNTVSVTSLFKGIKALYKKKSGLRIIMNGKAESCPQIKRLDHSVVGRGGDKGAQKLSLILNDFLVPAKLTCGAESHLALIVCDSARLPRSVRCPLARPRACHRVCHDYLRRTSNTHVLITNEKK